MARLGTALLALGLLALGYGALWQLGLAPGSRVVLPAPVALERAGAGTREIAAPITAAPTSAANAPLAPPPTGPAPTLAVPPRTPAPTPRDVTLDPTPTPAGAALDSGSTPPGSVREPGRGLPASSSRSAPITPADQADRAEVVPPETGYAVRLAIPAIKLDTLVQQAGIVEDADGNPIWETLPFVAVHYGDLTALIGARGNAVIAGHVVTLSQGNVFRLLYQLDLEDHVQVWDDRQAEHDFRIVDVRLVPPSDTSVMAPTPEQTLTLITCGGTFDPVKREFSDRLIVTAKPL